MKNFGDLIRAEIKDITEPRFSNLVMLILVFSSQIDNIWLAIGLPVAAAFVDNWLYAFARRERDKNRDGLNIWNSQKPEDKQGRGSDG